MAFETDELLSQCTAVGGMKPDGETKVKRVRVRFGSHDPLIERTIEKHSARLSRHGAADEARLKRRRVHQRDSVVATQINEIRAIGRVEVNFHAAGNTRTGAI
jgi:hypothetical protein